MKRILAALFLSVTVSALVIARQAAGVPAAAVDAIFARWTPQTPGCAVGVSKAGQPVLQKAYGMADLEHGVPKRSDTIVQAGSVSKQLPAAAVLLVVKDGIFSLVVPARTYVLELPHYGSLLTIRHVLQHNSALREWGEVAGVAGWTRATRVHTHAPVRDFVTSEKGLNF